MNFGFYSELLPGNNMFPLLYDDDDDNDDEGDDLDHDNYKAEDGNNGVNFGFYSELLPGNNMFPPSSS